MSSTSRRSCRAPFRDLAQGRRLGAVLTGLMVLLFLRDWRSAFIVVINIPLSLLAATFALWLSGQNINLMTLGGLALAVGILVDEATVAVENIHAHLARGTPSLARAALDATLETAVPRLLAMLVHPGGVHPGFLHGRRGQGALRASGSGRRLLHGRLLPALQHAGAGADGLDPARARAHQADATETPAASGGFARLQLAYAKFAARGCACAGCSSRLTCWRPASSSVLVGRRLGTEIFPTVESGQLALRLRAPAGTRVENTEQLALKVLDLIKREVGSNNVALTMGLVGRACPQLPGQPDPPLERRP